MSTHPNEQFHDSRQHQLHQHLRQSHENILVSYTVLHAFQNEILNDATTPDGDILLSTKNFATGDNYTIIVEFR